MIDPPVAAPAFRHDEVGTEEAVWEDDRRWSQVPLESLADSGGHPATRVVVLAAHPDDETLGAAGLLAMADDAGTEIHVVVATDGEASHPGSPTHPPDVLAAVRRDEVVAAVAACAPQARVHLLGLPDGGVHAHDHRLAAVLTGLVDDSTLLLAPWRRDGHPDHEAAGQVAATVADAQGARLLEYPIWLWHWGSRDDLPWNQVARLDLPDTVRRAKTAALAHHRSQHEALSPDPADAALLLPPVLAHFTRSWETFVDAGASRPDQRVAAFDAMYEDGDDPWGAASWYERRKRAVCLSALPEEQLGRVLEIGCATGVLTTQLAERAETVVAVDHSARALAVAGRRLADRPRVRLRQASLPRQWPAGRWDTVVVSEVGYFLGAAEVDELLDHIDRSLDPDGSLLLCHWLHPVEGYPVQGDEVHARASEMPGLTTTVSYRDADFRVDVLRRRGLPSVAEAEGLA